MLHVGQTPVSHACAGEGHGWHVRTAALKDLFYWYGGLRREQERPWLWGLLLHPQRLDQVVVLVARCLEEVSSYLHGR